ncbi:1-phosphofructokinase family hexose kinase [Alkalihalobacillus sp. BA299]|uniref:1-phosphofructokinase family hexose kinase n=1 Tax=Alkalihalobacillus sp. BA299 TaxID=2815938 RepID=UPI001ADBF655|nr:1-phosphofructokinase family hexose kinase [Alkalihalobacillus sp. BA299]
MIGTITLNPSIDICYYIDEFHNNEVNRCSNYYKTAGGKGLNVSKVLKQLGCEIMPTGFLGGENGQLIKKELNHMNITPNFVEINEDTRNCIAILSKGSQTEILETGPTISERESESLLQLILNLIMKRDLKVISASGSIPHSLGSNYYYKLIKLVNEKKVKFVLDTSGASLRESLLAAPFLIKPNIFEIEDLLNVRIESEKDVITSLYKLRDYNIEMIVVSLGQNGSIALCGDKIYKASIPNVKVINPVGSGDAMVAGMVKEIHSNSCYEEILRVGNTCGILNAMNKKTGEIDLSYFKEIYDQIHIEKVIV